MSANYVLAGIVSSCSHADVMCLPVAGLERRSDLAILVQMPSNQCNRTFRLQNLFYGIRTCDLLFQHELVYENVLRFKSLKCAVQPASYRCKPVDSRELHL